MNPRTRFSNVMPLVDAKSADAGYNRCLQPMAEAAKKVLGVDGFHTVADAGYSNGEQAAHCEAAGMLPHVPVMRTVNNQGDGRWRVVVEDLAKGEQIPLRVRDQSHTEI